MVTRKKFLSVLIIVLLALGALLAQKLPLSAGTDQATEQSQNNQQLTINGVHYLLEVSDLNPNKIKALLDRAEELFANSQASKTVNKVVMVIHGDNVELFDKKNYVENKALIDQAARLDAFDVIDFKICQTAATIRGINKSSFPPFLEVVFFSGFEISRLESKGYVEL